MNTPLPTSDATNAYDLLTDIRRLIREEPKRYDQHTWIEHPLKGGPSCGTVGCVAGWVWTLKRPEYTESIADAAAKILGLEWSQAAELFNGGAVTGEAQTWWHGVQGRRHIWRFQRKYATQLKAKSI